jgi:manganese/zinc/iron transport system permease protein
MSLPQFEIILVATVTAAACAMPGVFLVLRRMAMMSDAISHTILLGIVIGFFITENLAHPLLILGATITGILTVSLVELLQKTRLVREDAAIGLIFPFLFSIAVILISRYAGQVHLDTDAVLLGELAFTPFNRLTLWGVDAGPLAFYLMGGILVMNLVLLTVFYKELKLVTFDAGLAAALGFAPALIHYGLMGMVSITAVAAFDTVGSILVVAMMIAPPATAYLLTDRLPVMIGLSIVLGAVSAVFGYWLAHLLDASIAGSMAVMMGFIFGLAFLFSPEKGVIAGAQRQKRQRWDFAQIMLVVHLFNHAGQMDAEQENKKEHMHEHMRWSPEFAQKVIDRSIQRGYVNLENGQLTLTNQGLHLARQSLEK